MADDSVIAIDIGGTQLRVALFAGGALQDRAALPTDVEGGPSGVMDQIDRLIDRLCPGAARGAVQRRRRPRRALSSDRHSRRLKPEQR